MALSTIVLSGTAKHIWLYALSESGRVVSSLLEVSSLSALLFRGLVLWSIMHKMLRQKRKSDDHQPLLIFQRYIPSLELPISLGNQFLKMYSLCIGIECIDHCISNVSFLQNTFSSQDEGPPIHIFNTFGSKWEKKTTAAKVEQKAVEYYRQYLGTGLWAFVFVYHYSHRANSSLPAGPPASTIHRVNSIFLLLRPI